MMRTSPGSCDAYNRRFLYALAKESNVPVAKIRAFHTGVDENDAASFADELFAGLPSVLEICEGAPVIYTHNLWVAAGLINGTRGTIRAIVYRHGNRPDHASPACRMPSVVIVECASFVGRPPPLFFFFLDEPERAKWVPFFPREVKYENDNTISRTQVSFVLAWALTPWKAQGMSLDKVVVKLGKAAARPGVAFVALTRARHPDGLALDDSFPSMSTFQRQVRHKNFQKRHVFELHARALFLINDPTTYARWSCLFQRTQVDC